jgi:RNA polymerase sigma-70 factor, ECF subfamily
MNAPDVDQWDAQDMIRLAGGHDAALNDLMNRHAERLFHYLVRSLQDESDAADLCQETFAKVYQHRARFDARQKFSTWLYTIASNLVRSRYRWRSRHPQISIETPNPDTGTEFKEQLTDNVATPSESLEKLERAEAVRKAVAALPEDLRLPLLLAEYEERSQAEIAAILDCTVKAVETRIYRARKQLRERLEPLLRTA